MEPGRTETASPGWFDPALHWISLAIEAIGVLAIVIGAIAAGVMFARALLAGGNWPDAYHRFRTRLARAILLGLEFLVAADIIGTVAVEPTLDNLAVLGLIVLIRTFLSFSLEIEIEGRLPWKKAVPPGAGRETSRPRPE